MKDSTKRAAAINKLKKVLEECSQLKTELNSIKNLTFKAKRNIDVSIKNVKDRMKRSIVSNSTKRAKYEQNLDSNKQNDSNAINFNNSLGEIKVMLGKQKTNHVFHGQQEKLGQKIMLELQEIKLLEQRQNLICKKNTFLSMKTILF